MISYHASVNTNISNFSRGSFIRTTYGDKAYYIGITNGQKNVQNGLVLLYSSKDIIPANGWTGWTQVGAFITYGTDFISGDNTQSALAITMHQYNAAVPHIYKIDSFVAGAVTYGTTSDRQFAMPTAFKLNGRNFVGWGAYAIEDDGTTE